MYPGIFFLGSKAAAVAYPYSLVAALRNGLHLEPLQRLSESLRSIRSAPGMAGAWPAVFLMAISLSPYGEENRNFSILRAGSPIYLGRCFWGNLYWGDPY
jgi:hypothetical protein